LPEQVRLIDSIGDETAVENEETREVNPWHSKVRQKLDNARAVSRDKTVRREDHSLMGLQSANFLLNLGWVANLDDAD
jgi:hypothetical protein